MNKTIVFIVISLLASFKTKAQVTYSAINLNDSIYKIDTSKSNAVIVSTLNNIGTNYAFYKGDSAMLFFKRAEKIAINNNLLEQLPLLYFMMSLCSSNTIGNYPAALAYSFEMLKLTNKLKVDPITNQRFLVYSYYSIANSYSYLLNKVKSNLYLDMSLEQMKLLEPKLDSNTIMAVYGMMTQTVIRNNDLEKAKKFNNLCIQIDNSIPYEGRWSIPYISQGVLYETSSQYQEAINSYKKSIPHSLIRNVLKDIIEAHVGIANSFYKLNQFDSSLVHCNKVIQYSSIIVFSEGLQKTYDILYHIYKVKNVRDSAYKYLELSNTIKESISNNLKANEAQNLAINEEVKLREISEERQKQQKILFFTSIGFITSIFIFYFLIKRNQKNKLSKIEDERKNKELQVARDLQISMLPKVNPQRDDLDIATFIRSSTEVGGDYYDFMTTEQQDIISICGDATGHGVASGMMVSVAKTGLKAINIEHISAALFTLNNIIKEINLGKLRMSLNLTKIGKNKIEIASAAMPPTYLYSAIKNDVEEILFTSLPLGSLKNIEYEAVTKSFESGDILVQITDGLPEAPNKEGVLYDYDRLRNLIASANHLSAKEIINVLINSVDEWMEHQNNPDDITLVVTKKK